MFKRLPNEILRLLFMNTIAMVVFNYIAIFINLYVWKEGKSFFLLSWYNLATYIILFIGYACGAKWLEKGNARTLMIVSSLFACLAFLVLNVIHVSNHVVQISIIAVFLGFMHGLYWSGMNLSIFSFLKGKDFEEYFSISTMFSQFISIFIPIFSAIIIKYVSYQASFIFMFFLVLLMFVLSFFIPKFSLHQMIPEGKSLFSTIGYSHLFSFPSLRWIVPLTFVTGLFMQFQGLFGTIFTFNVTEDSLGVALLNVVYTLVMMVAIFIHKKAKIKESMWLWIGISVMFLGFSLVLFHSAPILIIGTLCTKIGLLYLNLVGGAQSYRIIENIQYFTRAKMMIWQEFTLLVSRSFVLVTVLYISDIKSVLFTILLVVTAISGLLIPVFQTKAFKEFEQKKNNQ